MVWTLTTSQAIIMKAGVNLASSVATSGGLMALASDMAEAELAIRTKFDWVTNYTDTTSVLRPILSDVASDLAAIKVIGYDMGNYVGGTGQAVAKINVLLNSSDKVVKLLEDKNNIQPFMGV